MNQFNKVVTVISENSRFGLAKQYFYSDGILVPNKAIKGNKLYKISIIDPAYKIFALTVTTINDKLKYVHAHALHPNINPETLLYCLAPHYANSIYNQQTYLNLLNVMTTYYLDTCYFNPMDLKDQLIFQEQATVRFNGKGEVIN
jgi:uncharacterized protein YifN (PemK superfamily)